MNPHIKRLLKEQFEVAHKMGVIENFIDLILPRTFDIIYDQFNGTKCVGTTTFTYPPEAIKATEFDAQKNRLFLTLYFPHKSSYDQNSVKIHPASKHAIIEQLKKLGKRYNIELVCHVEDADLLEYDEDTNDSYYLKLADETTVGSLNYIYKN